MYWIHGSSLKLFFSSEELETLKTCPRQAPLRKWKNPFALVPSLIHLHGPVPVSCHPRPKIFGSKWPYPTCPWGRFFSHSTRQVQVWFLTGRENSPHWWWLFVRFKSRIRKQQMMNDNQWYSTNKSTSAAGNCRLPFLRIKLCWWGVWNWRWERPWSCVKKAHRKGS